MISLTRKEVKTFRTLCCRALAKGERGRPLFVRFIGGLHAQRLQFRTGKIDLDWELPARGGSADFAIPFEALGLCEGNDEGLVTFRKEGDEVHVEWTNGAIPHRRGYADEAQRAPAVLPEPPELHSLGEAPVFPALAEAHGCANEDALRFAVDCLALRGGKLGEVAATDASMLLVRGGVPWPWQEQVLVPMSKVYGSKELAEGPVAVGKTRDHVVLRRRPWTLWLAIESERRFPPIDEILPKAAMASQRLELHPDDAAFLGKNLPKLPRMEPEDRVTLHLNGQAIVRAKGEGGPATELILRNSRHEGPDLLRSMNPRFLGKAVRLGFTELRFWKGNSLAMGLDGSRRFVWMCLPDEGAYAAEPRATRIESPKADPVRPKAAPSNPGRERKATPARPIERTQPMTTAMTQPVGHAWGKPVNLVQEAEALRSQLRGLLARSSFLVAELKRQKRQRRVVRNARALLPQLQEAT